MKEQIILAPGLNGNELIKSLAMHGISSFNLRVCSAAELARMALMRSGVSITETIISRREETIIAAEAIKGVKYFEKTSISDVEAVATAIRKIRGFVSGAVDEVPAVSEILKNGPLESKNAALLAVFRNYRKIMSEKKLIDSVSLIRKALTDCKNFDAELIVLNEYPLSPLEKALAEVLSAGKMRHSSLFEIFAIKDKQVRINSNKRCYGAPNEVETVIADIYSGKSLDKSTVAVTDPILYGQLFFDTALLYDIPISFGCGISIVNANPAKLLVLYQRWISGRIFSAASLKEMLLSSSFDGKRLGELCKNCMVDEKDSWKKYLDVISSIRLTDDAEINDHRVSCFEKAVAEEEALVDPDDDKEYKGFLLKKHSIPYLKILSVELAKAPEVFIPEYSYIRKGSGNNAEKLLMSLDISARSVISDELRILRTSGVEQTTEDMIDNILKIRVSSGSSEPGKLFVTSIDGAMSVIRDNLYIAGLSASKYPGTPRQDYLLLDDDLPDNARHMNSNEIIRRKEENLMTLAKIACGMGATVNVSFSGLNVSELKSDNPSSLVYRLFREENGDGASSKDFEKCIQSIGYFDPAISATRMIGEAYNNGDVSIIPLQKTEKESSGIQIGLEKYYSPSTLERFFSCKRRFMLSNVFGIPDPDEDKPFELIAANETGTLAHSLMKVLGNSQMSLEEFLGLSTEYFDRFIAEKPPLIMEDVEAERAQFLDMMETAYRIDPHREVVLGEKDIECCHESGVRIHGFPDRVEKLEDGTYLIVDFKSGQKIKHKENDIDTCLQIMIYAYLMEHQKDSSIKISGGEYRYIKLGKTVSCKYDDEIKQALAQKLEEFKQAIISFDFPVSENADCSNNEKNPCTYCKFGMICGEITSEGGAEDE